MLPVNEAHQNQWDGTILRIGFGCTGLVRGITPGHIDGIVVYTNELLYAIPRVDPACILKPTLFGFNDGVAQQSALRFALPYEVGSDRGQISTRDDGGIRTALFSCVKSGAT